MNYNPPRKRKTKCGDSLDFHQEPDCILSNHRK